MPTITNRDGHITYEEQKRFRIVTRARTYEYESEALAHARIAELLISNPGCDIHEERHVHNDKPTCVTFTLVTL